MKTALATAVALAVAGLLAAAVVVYGGLYDISATDQHLAPTYKVLDTAMRRSVKRRADAIVVPPLGERALLDRGLALYRKHCRQCHGAPGVAPDAFRSG